ncbi:MAG: hypothetical protein IJK04_13010 [Kiritimatiellae bacterium]|nr:hypothetical protein [Kiritimatiellia bacterium]
MNKLSIALIAAAFAGLAFAEPTAKARSIVIEPRSFVKDRNVRIEKDNIDNFQYARLANFDTNAPLTAVSYKVTAAQAGKWHVLLDLRSGAAVALDQDAALAIVEAPADPKAGISTNAPLASVHVTGSLGDEAWQIVSLGVVDMPAGSVIRLAPRSDATTAPVPRYTDLRRITLLDPEFISETREALPKK